MLKKVAVGLAIVGLLVGSLHAFPRIVLFEELTQHT